MDGVHLQKDNHNYYYYYDYCIESKAVHYLYIKVHRVFMYHCVVLSRSCLAPSAFSALGSYSVAIAIDRSGPGSTVPMKFKCRKAFGYRVTAFSGTRWRLGARLPPRRAIPCTMHYALPLIFAHAVTYRRYVPLSTCAWAPPPREIRKKRAGSRD